MDKSAEKMIEEKENSVKPIVIAMKGHPGTGKSTLAEAISRTLKYPLIDKDHFRDCTHPIQQALLMHNSPPFTVVTSLLNQLSYEVMWRLISAQLRLGISVVLDSPLSRKYIFERLLEVADENDAQVVVVECRPGDMMEWRRRVEMRGESGGSRWHKPSNWEEMERLLESYDGCWDYDVGQVRKLVLDTTAHEDHVAKVVEFVNS